MARHVASAPFATTRKCLLSTVAITAIFLMGVALVAGVFRGFNTSLDVLLGATVALLPGAWVAISLTSGRSAISPVWMGLARYSMAAAGFAALFILRPHSEPASVLAGSALALFLPAAVMVWHQRWANKMPSD